MKKPKRNRQYSSSPQQDENQGSHAGTYRLSEASRKAATEFGIANRASALLRNALSPLIFPNASRTLHRRLSGRLSEVIRSCGSSSGERSIAEGNLSLLADFQLNCYTRFTTVAPKLNLSIGFDPKGRINIRIYPVDPQGLRSAPNSNLAIIRIIEVAVDFSLGSFEVMEANDLVLDLDGPAFRGGTVLLPFRDTENKVLIAAAAVFFANRSGQSHSFPADRKYTVGKIVDAVYIRNGKIVKYETAPRATSPRLPAKQLVTNKAEWNVSDENDNGL